MLILILWVNEAMIDGWNKSIGIIGLIYNSIFTSIEFVKI